MKRKSRGGQIAKGERCGLLDTLMQSLVVEFKLGSVWASNKEADFFPSLIGLQNGLRVPCLFSIKAKLHRIKRSSDFYKKKKIAGRLGTA